MRYHATNFNKDTWTHSN